MPNTRTCSFRRFRYFFSRVLLGIAICCNSSQADDIEVFTGGKLTGYRPNILFVLDYSGSMDTLIDTTDPSKGSRISVLRDAMEAILEQNASRINAGVTLFSEHTSGVLWPVSDLTQYANNTDPQIPRRNDLSGVDVVRSIINNHPAGGSTATVGALMEAALYYSGGNVAAGGALSANNGILTPRQWSNQHNSYYGEWYQPHPASYFSAGSGNAATYVSPISNQCQKNFVVLISDGEPTELSEFPELTQYAGPLDSCESLSSTIFTSGGNSSELGNCGPEIVTKMQASAGNSAFPDSTVSTYTIGFNIGQEGEKYLSRLAADGGGEFFPADKPEDLTVALDKIIGSILGDSHSFSELSFDINKATFSDDNRVYFPLFRPAGSSSWTGNLKGYFIGEQGLIDTNGNLAIASDVNGTRFVDEAQSFWSSSPDGNEVEEGGAAEKLATTNRAIYTYTGGGNPNGVTLSGPGESHHVSESNSALDYQLLGIANSSSLRSELIAWLHDAPMGDALHSKSVPVNYANRTVVYQATNQGLLHAIDASSPTTASGDHSGGQEIFAFIPPELLPNLERIRNNDTSQGHIYGLDGSVTRWHNDANKDGIVNGNDTLMLIIGMRRGGNNYYALDVSNPDQPRYMWNITGGGIDFPELSQSWSRMSLITVINQGQAERVLVFGGGYDANKMDGATKATQASGNSIYMVGANGNKIWSASHQQMRYSIASDLRVIDSDDDGFADRIYAPDLGGQIWRIDFDDVSNASSFKVNRLAALNSAGFQPFFYPPSVALNSRASNQHLTVAIGSGNRTQPLREDTRNRIFMLKDYDADKGAPGTDFSTIQLSHLYNATNNDPGSDNPAIASQARSALHNSKGWYIDLAAGEKTLSKTLAFEGRLMATTFSPTGSGNTDQCAVQATTSRYYAMDIQDATPASLSIADSTAGDRSQVIATAGIPSSPIVVFPTDSDNVQVMVDRATVSYLEQKINRVMWHPRD